MKRRARLFLLLATLPLAVRAAEAPATDPAPAQDQKTAPTLTQQITAGLPKWTPPPPPEEPKPANAPNPDVLVLPKMTIKQKPRPRLTPDLVATSQALGADLVKKNRGEFDRALNKFTLPLFGSSAEERALDDYRRERARALNLDVLSISKALEAADPAEAKALKDASTAAATTATAPR